MNDPTTTRQILTAKEALALMQEAAARGEIELDLRGRELENLCLCESILPVSLDLSFSIIHGAIWLSRSTLKGAYIKFDGATIKGFVSMNGIKSDKPYDLSFRGTILHKEIHIENTAQFQVISIACF